MRYATPAGLEKGQSSRGMHVQQLSIDRFSSMYAK